MAISAPNSYLLVEGKDDLYVIAAVAQRLGIPQFKIETASIDPHDDSDGIDKLLAGIPVRLKEKGLATLGIVVDADENLLTRWQALVDRLRLAGYGELPKQPKPEGENIDVAGKPRLGIWLMPNNQTKGILENFVLHLIPEDEPLKNKVNQILDELETVSLNRYPAVRRPKATIHTWLAWQKEPGKPMGTAITAKVLQADNPIAVTFADWLKRLFSEVN